jgi:inorganic pyrophosphatase
VLVVPRNEHRWSAIVNASDLSERMRDELLEFFRSSLVLTGKTVKFDGFADADEAIAHVLAGAERF